MFCTTCGGKIPDDSQFCTICGQPVSRPQQGKQINYQQGQQFAGQQYNQQNQQFGGQQQYSQQGQQFAGQQNQQYSQQGQQFAGQQNQQYSQQSQQYSGQQGQQYANQQNQQHAGQQKKHLQAIESRPEKQRPAAQNSSRKMMIVVMSICAFVIVAALGILLYFKVFWKKTVEVDMSEYVKVSFEGYDGIGTATVYFDQDSFYDDYADDIKYIGNGPDDADEYYDAAEYLLYVYVSGTLDKSTGLTNGDTVNYIWDVDKKGIKDNLNVEIEFENVPFTVSGLQSVGQTDVFQYVTVSFDGDNGAGKVTITAADDSPVASWNFVSDKTEGLTNGDSILVSVNDDGTLVDSFVSATGTSPLSLSREYVVSGLTEDSSADSDMDDDKDKDDDKDTASNDPSSDGMVIPDSSTRMLTEDEVKKMSQDQIQTAINEIYARNGYKFKDQGIYNYFCQYDWYDPKTTNQEDAKRMFNSTENYNVDLLQKYRE